MRLIGFAMNPSEQLQGHLVAQLQQDAAHLDRVCLLCRRSVKNVQYARRRSHVVCLSTSDQNQQSKDRLEVEQTTAASPA